MNPLSLRLRNVRSFEQIDLDLPVGCVALVGENGAGKSTLVNAIDTALFGPSGRSFRPALTRGAASTELMVELVFDHAGELYRVRRSFSARGAGKTTVDLERRDDAGWEEGLVVTWTALTLGSVKETQALLESILGFSRATFRASSFLVQRDASAFTLADPGDRKKILHAALGLERYGRLRDAVRRDLRAAEAETQRIDGRLQGITREQLTLERASAEGTLKVLSDTVVSATTALTAAETDLLGYAEAVEQAKAITGQREAATARRAAAAAALAAKVKVRDDAAEAETRASAVRFDLAALPAPGQTAKLEQRERDLAATVEAYNVAVRERQQTLQMIETREAQRLAIVAQANATRAKADDLDLKIAHLLGGEVDHCPTCEQALGVAAREATIGSLRAQAQTAVDEAKALEEQASGIIVPAFPAEPERPELAESQLISCRELLAQARAAELQRSRLDERLAGLQRTIDLAASAEYAAELAACESAVRAIDADIAELPPPVDVAPLEAAAVQARARVEVERERLQTAQQQKVVAQERLDQLTARAAQLEQDLADRDTLTGRIDLLSILDRAYGPDGIPALILENAAIPQLENESGRLLALLGGPVSRIELRTDRAKQDGGVRDDVLDIVCVTDSGDCVYDDLSGGEGFRVDIALRLALAQLLATRRGAEVRLLVIDEPDGLDASGKQALIEILRDLEARGGLDRIYLISHDADLRDSFDTLIEVVKDETGRSRVEGALEAVAA